MHIMKTSIIKITRTIEVTLIIIINRYLGCYKERIEGRKQDNKSI